MSGAPANTFPTVIANGSDAERGFQVYMNFGNPATATGVDPGDATVTSFKSRAGDFEAAPVVVDSAKHVAICFDPSGQRLTTYHNAVVYTDQVIDGTMLGTGEHPAASNPFLIGFGVGVWLSDLVMFHGVVLSPERVAAHYNSALIAPVIGTVPTVTATADRTRMSRVLNFDATTVTWSSDQPFTSYQIRAVTGAGATVVNGLQIEANQSPAAGGSANVVYVSTITDDELVAAGVTQNVPLTLKSSRSGRPGGPQTTESAAGVE